MSGNRDELPERTGGDADGSPRSRQQESQQEIAERLGIDPEQVATRDTLDRGVQQRLTEEGTTEAERSAAQRVAEQAGFIQRDDVSADVDPGTFAVEQRLTEEGTSEAERRLAEETAADQEFVRPSDLEADVDPETFTAEATLTEEGREAAQQRQAEQLRQQAASQSDRFGESDFRVDRSGEEISVEPTEAAVDRERREQAAQQFEAQSQFIGNVEPQQVELTDNGAQLPDQIIDRAEARAQRQAQQQASQQRQEARQDFAESIESGSAFGDLPDGVDPASLVDNVDPNEDIVREGDSLALSDDVQGRINSQLESDALQQQRQQFASALESGEAFESGEAPDALGSVDPQTDVVVEDGSLTLADDTQADIIESQIRAQAGPTPGLNTDNVLERAASQDEILRAVEEQIEEQTGTDTRSGLIEDANLSVNADGTIEADRVLLNSRRFDDFRDVSTLRANTDLLDGADLSVNATEAFSGQVEQSIAQQISERNVVDVSSDQIDISGGNVSTQTPESLTIENDQITADGLTESGQSDFARRQLQSIQTTEGVSVDTPVNSQAFANVSATLAQAAEGGGSLSSATRIVAASETVDNIGDLDDLPDSQIIAGLEPDQAEQRLNIDASTVRAAQSDIQQRRQQLNNDPGAVLESIASNQDEFINDSSRIGVAGERGQRIRQAARTQLNELEADIAAGDDDVAPGDVGLTLTDDLSGIRSIDEGGRQAIAQSVDEQLPNFDSSEIDVGVSDGQITTSIEDSVRDRFVQNAQRVQEIQVRNQIADETEGIGRRDIEVDAGEGVSPSDELVTETLGTDVNADIESFDQLQQAAEMQARFQARQQAIQQVESQTIGSVYPGNVSVERTSDGFEANVSGAAAQTTNLSAVDAAAPATDPIDLGTGQQGSDEPLIQAGEDLPDSIGEVPGAVAGGGEFVDINAPTRPPEIRRAVSDTAQDALGVDIDRDIGRQTLQDVRSTGRDIVTGDFDAPDASSGGLAGAAGIAVAAPEPVSTGTGAAVLGGLALGGAITSFANQQAEIDVPEQSPASGFSEIDIGQTQREINEVDIPTQSPGSNLGEVDIPTQTPAATNGEIDIPTQSPSATVGEVDVPSINTQQFVQPEQVEEEEEDDNILGEEDIPINPFDNPREQGSTPERFIREDRDAFVIRNPETPEINQEQAQEPTVNEAIDTGVGSEFGTGTGVGAGTEPIAPVGSDVDTRPGVNVGAGPEVGTGIGTGTGVDSDVETGVDTRFETPTRQQTTTQNTFAQPTINETVPGFETGFEGQPNRPGRTRRPPRRPDLGVDPDETETTESPRFRSADDLFDSGILSGSEALDESFSR